MAPVSRTSLRALLVACSATFSQFAAVHATGPVRLAVQPADANGRIVAGPGYFVVHTQPGHHVHLYARVSNRGMGTITMALRPVDARHDPAGNISYNLPGQPRRQVGAWVHLVVGKFTLHQGQRRTIAFLVLVPRMLAPGTYIGALTAYVPRTGPHPQEGAVIQVQMRLAVAIVVFIQRKGG
jgi:hypothetical protein